MALASGYNLYTGEELTAAIEAAVAQAMAASAPRILPIIDPQVAGMQWDDDGVIKISQGIIWLTGVVTYNPTSAPVHASVPWTGPVATFTYRDRTTQPAMVTASASLASGTKIPCTITGADGILVLNLTLNLPAGPAVITMTMTNIVTSSITLSLSTTITVQA